MQTWRDEWMKKYVIFVILLAVITGVVGVGFLIQQNNAVTWVQGTSRPAPGQYIDCVVADGMIYTINGRRGSLGGMRRYSNLYVYDPASDNWTQKTAPPVFGDAGTSGLVNGKIYYTHFFSEGRGCLEYDIATDTWTRRSPNNLTDKARWDANGGVVDGKLYVIGGMEDVPYNNVFEYDPDLDVWTQMTSAPTNHDDLWKYGVCIHNDQIYCFGLNVYVYTPRTDTWETRSASPTETRSVWATRIPLHGRVYVWFSETLFAYDIEADTFTRVGDCPDLSANHCSGGVIEDRAYLIGGGRTCWDLAPSPSGQRFTEAVASLYYIEVK